MVESPAMRIASFLLSHIVCFTCVPNSPCPVRSGCCSSVRRNIKKKKKRDEMERKERDVSHSDLHTEWKFCERSATTFWWAFLDRCKCATPRGLWCGSDAAYEIAHNITFVFNCLRCHGVLASFDDDPMCRAEEIYAIAALRISLKLLTQKEWHPSHNLFVCLWLVYHFTIFPFSIFRHAKKT